MAGSSALAILIGMERPQTKGVSAAVVVSSSASDAENTLRAADAGVLLRRRASDHARPQRRRATPGASGCWCSQRRSAASISAESAVAPTERSTRLSSIDIIAQSRRRTVHITPTAPAE